MQQREWCFNPDKGDQAVAACTSLIQSGRETSANLSLEYYNRGIAYRRKGLYDQAIADHNRAIALTPGDADAYQARGVAYRYRGLYDLAIADYTQAIALKPDYEGAYAARG